MSGAVLAATCAGNCCQKVALSGYGVTSIVRPG